jgi:predicted GNAT family acetyltransferase
VILVTRHPSAASFLDAARSLLLTAEAENNLILGVSEGLARNPSAASDPYLATASEGDRVLACATYLSPFKVLLTRASRDPIAALAQDAFAAIPGAEGITGPDQSAADFASAWSALSGVQPRIGMRMRIHETRRVVISGLPGPSGGIRPAHHGDRELLAAWTQMFAVEASIPEKIDPDVIVANGIKRGRLYVWDDEGPKSMAGWAGKTPNGVRIHFVYTPRERRRRGYATACVSALTRLLLEQGNSFCWLYTDVSSAGALGLFQAIGYVPVSDVAEYYLQKPQAPTP